MLSEVPLEEDPIDWVNSDRTMSFRCQGKKLTDANWRVDCDLDKVSAETQEYLLGAQFSRMTLNIAIKTEREADQYSQCWLEGWKVCHVDRSVNVISEISSLTV